MLVDQTFPFAAKTDWDIVPEEKAMFFSSSEGRKCVYMQIYQSPWKCSKYMVCLCSKYAKINRNVLSIFFLMFQVRT
jgi:hypothetical protein